MSNPEQAVRDAALKLQNAIKAARESGLHVEWPSRPEALDAIAISETGKAKVAVTVQADPAGAVDPATSAKATTAAQKAADKVVSNAG